MQTRMRLGIVLGCVSVLAGLGVWVSMATGQATLTPGTLDANYPVLDSAVVWNNAGIVGPAWKLNVTDTSSNAASLLADLQVGGVSKWKVDKTGKVTQTGILLGPGGNAAAPTFAFTPEPGTGWYWDNSSIIGLALAGTSRVRIHTATMLLGPMNLAFGVNVTTQDLILARDAANTLAQRNGTTAQESRLYNLDSGANDEYFTIDWKATANRVAIGPKATGTGTLRDLIVDHGAGVLFANLGTPANGQQVYCSDCTFADPCAGSGTGAIAKRLNGAWRCD
jgi:hypothetical protein